MVFPNLLGKCPKGDGGLLCHLRLLASNRNQCEAIVKFYHGSYHPAGFNTAQALPIFDAFAQLFFAMPSEKPEIMIL